MANTRGVFVDLGAQDLEFENVLFARNERGIDVNASYSANKQLRVRFSTFGDGTYGVYVDASIDLRLHRNIFYAGSVPGGFGVNFAMSGGGATVGEKLENLFSGYTTAANKCVEQSGGQCAGVVWSSAEAQELGDGYYLEQDLSAAVNAAGQDASAITLGDGTILDAYTTALDLVLDKAKADLGFHHPPCNETLDDEGCGDGSCAGGETSGTCPEDCP